MCKGKGNVNRNKKEIAWKMRKKMKLMENNLIRSI